MLPYNSNYIVSVCTYVGWGGSENSNYENFILLGNLFIVSSISTFLSMKLKVESIKFKDATREFNVHRKRLRKVTKRVSESESEGMSEWKRSW
jgi:hypothetical protein